jgi:hypothetical protein
MKDTNECDEAQASGAPSSIPPMPQPLEPPNFFWRSYTVPLLGLFIGILFGVMPPPSLAVGWAGSVISTALTGWMPLSSLGWARAGTYIGVALACSCCMEYTFVNLRDILTHFTHPQLAGVAALAPLADFLAVAAAYALACALLPSRGALAQAAGAAVCTLIAMIVVGPWESSLGYYTYNPPFLAWADSLGLQQVPPVPWEEPLGMAALALVVTMVAAVIGPRRPRGRSFSVKWAGLLFFSTQALPGWAWAAHTRRWELFALDTVLLAGLAALTLRLALAAARHRSGSARWSVHVSILSQAKSAEAELCPPCRMFAVWTSIRRILSSLQKT